VKRLKILLIIFILLFIIIQFIPVEKNNPKSEGVISSSGQISEILSRSCYDCHSNETKWPWYSKIAPISWRIAEHVEEGRKHLNFSTWGKYNLDQKRRRLNEIVEEVEEGGMPLKDYLLLHKEARLSDLDKALLKQWVNEQIKLMNTQE
jgi:hypothetical protein